MLLKIPPKMAISSFMGYLKEKSSLIIFEKWGMQDISIEIENFGAEDIMWIQ